MAGEDRSQGVIAAWFERMSKRYVRSLDKLQADIDRLPLGRFTITNTDIKLLRKALSTVMSMGDMNRVWEKIEELVNRSEIKVIEYEDGSWEVDWHDEDTFYQILGIIQGLSIYKIEKGELKPGNPVQEGVNEIKMKYSDLQVDEDDEAGGD